MTYLEFIEALAGIGWRMEPSSGGNWDRFRLIGCDRQLMAARAADDADVSTVFVVKPGEAGYPVENSLAWKSALAWARIQASLPGVKP